jgi:sugar-phosphatase
VSVTFRCHAVLFDLDGVLADSTEVVDTVWRAWARERGLDGDVIMRVAHGRPAKEVIARFAPELAVDEEVALLEEREAADTSGLVAIAGAEPLLQSLPPGAWAVVTSGTHALATSRLRALGLPLPEVLVTADQVTRGKPDPEAYLTAARRLGAATGDCVVIEDAPPGIEAGRAAGMPVIGVTTTYDAPSLSGAEVIVDTLEQIQARVAEQSRGLPLIELSIARAHGFEPPAR